MTVEITKKTVYKLLGYLGTATGLFFAFILMVEGAEEVLPFLFTSLTGGLLSMFKARALQNDEDEVKLVRLIREKEGRVNIGDVMEALGYSSKKAIKKLKLLEKRGVVTLDVDFDGQVVYGLAPI